MSKDIVPDLNGEIYKAFLSKSKESKILQEKLLALRNNQASYKDANDFAEELGEILADSFKDKIKTEDLPDGKMYYNIAQRIIDPNMHMTYDMVGDYSRDVQDLLNQEAGISINAQKAEINQDRIDKIVEKVSSYDSYDDGKWLLDEPIVNFSQSIVDDTIKTNADLHYQSGLGPKIERISTGKCCARCDKLAGVYDYESVKDTGNDVFRRHRHCRCIVNYVPEKGKRQDVWSKKWIDPQKYDKIEERILLSKQANPISGGISGAISDTNSPEARKFAETEYGSIRKRKVDIQRVAKYTGYSEKEIEEIKNYLFIEKHDLGDGEARRFDPSFEIAQSRNRLMRGNPEKHDFTLIEHEIYERKLISEGLNQNEAHKIASKKYNYRKESSEYYAKIKKRKKSR